MTSSPRWKTATNRTPWQQGGLITDPAVCDLEDAAGRPIPSRPAAGRHPGQSTDNTEPGITVPADPEAALKGNPEGILMTLLEQFGTDILLTGWGHTPFGRLADETLESLIVTVAREAITSAGLEPGQIDEIYLGQFNSGLVPLGFASSLALQVSDELANVPAVRVENACASGSAAFQQGARSLLAGTAKNVLVIGAEKMTHAGADTVGAALLGAAYETAGKASTTGFAGLFAETAQHYEKRYGQVSDVLGSIAAKNHRNGVANPYAHGGRHRKLRAALRSHRQWRFQRQHAAVHQQHELWR